MEDKTFLIENINEAVNQISLFLQNVNDDKLHIKPNNKWSIAENIIHLNKSVAPINMALSLPKIAFFPFGKAKNSLGYDKIVAKYQSALNNGGKASKQYEPNISADNLNKATLIEDFNNHYAQFCKKLDKWSEKNLDTYRLPHPLIGKITVRDMSLFTIYHLKHHYKGFQNN